MKSSSPKIPFVNSSTVTEGLRNAASLDRFASRIAVSMIVASLIIGSAILVMARVGEELYSMSLFGLVGFTVAAILGLYVVYSIFRGDGNKNQ